VVLSQAHARRSNMSSSQAQEITKLLHDWSQGDQGALDQLIPVVYCELRKLASGYLRTERPEHTLQPTALIHEAYLRLVAQQFPEWKNRAHFYGVAAQLMRQILVEHARTRVALKRGGAGEKVQLDEIIGLPQQRAAELVALDDALFSLASFDERKARVIELRFFGGLTEAETAQVLDISVATVRRDLRLAEAWLRRELSA
jgi:RNA polymerase sigma factor (TIGR02999 family)